MKFIDLNRQYNKYQGELEETILRVARSGQYILGPEVEALEKELSAFTGANFAVGVSSGTDALLLGLMALGVRPGDVVVTTPFSFFATVETIMLLGAEPAFVDIEEDTFNLDPELLGPELDRLEKLGKKVKGIVVVSLYGQCADMDPINEVASKRGLFVMEDACQSLGATYKGRPSCNLTDVAATSFFPSKPLGCFGDGGMVFTQDEEMADLFKALRIHGDTGRYKHEYLGINGRLDALQAAILRVKLKHFKEEIGLRQRAAHRYMELLSGLEEEGHIKLPRIDPEKSSVFAQFTIRVLTKERDALAKAMTEQGVPVAVHYPEALPFLRPLEHLGFKRGQFEKAERAAQQVLSLPMHAFIEEAEQIKVAEALGRALKA